MENGQRLMMDHPAIYKEVMRRADRYIDAMLGVKTEGNREAYENNKREIQRLKEEMREYLIPEGSYLFSRIPKFHYPLAEEAGILAEYLVVFCLKEYRTEGVYEQYLMHLLQIGVMNGIRDYIQEVQVGQIYSYLWKERAPYISDFFGPGLFDEPMDALKEMLVKAKEERVLLSGSGMLQPDMAFAGVLYVTEHEMKREVPCYSCKAKRGCEYCMKMR